MRAADFERVGLYDPHGPHAAPRLELLEFLVSLGATTDDLLAYREELPALASVLTLRGGTAVTHSEAAKRSGLREG